MFAEDCPLSCRKQYMAKYYLILSLFVFSSCSFLTLKNSNGDNLGTAKREVSSESGRLIFFDPATLSEQKVRMREFNLASADGQNEFKNSLVQFMSFYQSEAKNKKKILKESGVNSAQTVEGFGLRSPFNSFDPTEKGLYFAVKKMDSLVNELNSNPELIDIKLFQIKQLSHAVFNNYTPPMRDEYETLILPFTLLNHLYSPAVQSNNNLFTIETAPEIHNEFINNDFPLEASNLYTYKMLKVSEPCLYTKSKQGYGVHSGFQVKCGDESYKVKFGGEIYSGPFNTRIYSSMGYTVPTINYAEALRVKYDRRIIQEFNQRKALKINIYLAGKHITEFGERIVRDPFDEIVKFVLKDNSEVSSSEAKRRLMKKYDKKVDPVDDDFNIDFESQIDSVVLQSATLTLKEDSDKISEIGPWRADELSYAQFKEVRALMVLSSWVGNFDVRKDNLAIYLENPKSNSAKIKVGISDAGAGLGNATIGLTKVSSSDINKMLWEVSAVYKQTGEGIVEDRIQLVGLMNIEANRAFQNINMSDAQWMLKKMCQLTKQNILEALVASGMSSAEVVLTTEKLIYRRNKMLEHFNMSRNVAERCYVRADKKIDYNPEKDGLVEIKTSEGHKVKAPARNLIVRDGVLVSK